MTTDTPLVCVNGRLVPADEPVVCAGDRGFLYGDGLFETIRAYDGEPCLLEEHLARLAASAAALHFGDVVDPQAIAADVARLLEANRLPDAYIRITLTRGPHRGPLDLQPPDSPTLVIVARPVRAPSEEAYLQGQSAVIASTRQNVDSPLPRHKTLNYLGNLLARTEARQRGADEAILLNTRGEVAEAAASNVFLVLGERIITPPPDAGLLPGVTRERVLAVTRAAGRLVEERTVWPDELRTADELFLTNSVVEVMSLGTLDGRPIGAGPPWPMAADVRKAYRDSLGLARE